jgi:hypothetical protein
MARNFKTIRGARSLQRLNYVWIAQTLPAELQHPLLRLAHISIVAFLVLTTLAG